MEKQLSVEVVKKGDGLPQTEAELKALLKTLKQNKEVTDITTKAHKDFGNQIVDVEKKLASLAVGNAKTTRSYLDLGEQLRRTNPAFISFNQVVQDAPFGIRGVGNNLQFLTQQFTQLRSAGMSTSDILKGMMGNILTPMGGLMFAVSAGTSLLTVAMDGLGSKTEKTKEKAFDMNAELEKQKSLMDQIAETKYELGDISKAEYLHLLELELETLMLQRQALFDIAKMRNNPAFVPSNFSTTPRAPGFNVAGAYSTAVAQTADQTSIVENRNTMLSLDAQILDLRKRIKAVEAKVGIEGTPERPVSGGVFDQNWDKQFDRNLDRAIEAKFRAREKAIGEPKGFQIDEDTSYLDEQEVKNTEAMLRRATATYNSVFFDPLRASFNALATGSQDMADAFVDSIKRMIVQLLEFAAAAAILAMFGIGDFGTNFKLLSKIGSSTGNLPVPVDVAGDISRTMGTIRPPKQIVEIVGKARGEDLYYVTSNYVSGRNSTRRS